LAISVPSAFFTLSGISAVPIRILIVDAHPVILAGLTSILDQDPEIQIVGTVASGVEILDAVMQLRPDVVLIDPRLPETDAITLLRNLRTLAPKSKILLFAGPESKGDFPQAMKLGCSGVLLKDGQTKLIATAVRRVYAGEIWLDSTTTTAVIHEFAVTTRGSNSKTRDVTPREREIVILIAQGYKNPDIAEKLSISEQTVKNHLSKIFQKLNVSDRLELALYAVHHNLYELPTEPSISYEAERQASDNTSPPPVLEDGKILCSPA
jgi:two-component system, NarL family, nitrate/nitrite response regulator NarL